MNINSLGFGSKIKFVNQETFNKLPLKEAHEQNGYISYKSDLTADNIVKSTIGLTRKIYCCTSGGITNGKEITFFHLIPENKNVYGFEKIEQKLEEKINENYLSGLIVGGRSKEVRELSEEDDHLANCKRLYDKMKGFFTKKKIPHSTFWGHGLNDYGTDLFYSGKEDTWYINTTWRDVLSISSIKEEIKNIDDLKNAFQIIKISDKDKQDGIWINKDQLTDKEIDGLEQEKLPSRSQERFAELKKFKGVE